MHAVGVLDVAVVHDDRAYPEVLLVERVEHALLEPVDHERGLVRLPDETLEAEAAARALVGEALVIKEVAQVRDGREGEAQEVADELHALALLEGLHGGRHGEWSAVVVAVFLKKR